MLPRDGSRLSAREAVEEHVGKPPEGLMLPGQSPPPQVTALVFLGVELVYYRPLDGLAAEEPGRDLEEAGLRGSDSANEPVADANDEWLPRGTEDACAAPTRPRILALLALSPGVAPGGIDEPHRP